MAANGTISTAAKGGEHDVAWCVHPGGADGGRRSQVRDELGDPAELGRAEVTYGCCWERQLDGDGRDRVDAFTSGCARRG